MVNPNIDAEEFNFYLVTPDSYRDVFCLYTCLPAPVFCSYWCP